MTTAPVPGPPPYRVFDVDPANPRDAAWAARLHRDLFADIGLIAQLGDRLLRRVCYTVLVRDGLMRASLFEVDGQPAGLAAYTTDSKAFHTTAVRRYLPLVIRETVISMVLEPRIILGLGGAARLLLERGQEEVATGAPIAEMLALGVLPPFRTPEFVRRTGLRVADQLLAHAFGYFREQGFREARGVVLADNRPAMAFFRMRADRVEPYPNAAKPSLQVWFDLYKDPTLPARR
ncbi:MAG TPA: hypothetical protein VH763_14700 [Gemmatimonadales bacterium]|jgi:ribosomal protein S18 acetylase RimI-like enzyme